jgi:hypothetical protein
MRISVTNRIPQGLDWELLTEHAPILEALREECVDHMVEALYQNVRDQLGPDEMMWEGYWVDQKDLGTTNLYMVGVLKHGGMYFTRLIRVKEVPAAQRTETEQALTAMIAEYLDGLLAELERTVPPGKGKSGWTANGNRGTPHLP